MSITFWSERVHPKPSDARLYRALGWVAIGALGAGVGLWLLSSLAALTPMGLALLLLIFIADGVWQINRKLDKKA